MFETGLILGLTPYFSRHLALLWDSDAAVSGSSRHGIKRTTIMEVVLWQVFVLIAAVPSTERYSPCETRAF